MWFIEGAFAFQVKSHIQNGFDFLFAEIKVTDQVTAVKYVCIISSL